MKMGWAMVCLAINIALATTTAAASPEYSRAYESCMVRAQSADPLMTDCANEETDRQDAALNTAYRTLMGKLTGDAKAALLASERAWVTYRDTECRFEGSQEEGGTAEHVIYSGCVLQLTYRRVELLRDRLKADRINGPADGH